MKKLLMFLALAFSSPAVAQEMGPFEPEAPPVLTYEKSANAERSAKKWRNIWLAANALDLGGTIVAIESGKGREANPAAKLIFGKNIKTEEVIAFKAGGMALFALLAPKEPENRRIHYKVGAIITGAVGAVNLRVFF